MRVRDFVADLSDILAKTSKNESTLNLDIERLKLLCWGGADSELPLTKENLKPFYDFLMQRSIHLSKQPNRANPYISEADQVCAKLRELFERYLQPKVHDWASMITEMSKLPANQRIDFLADFNLAKLSKLILNGTDFRSKVNDRENYVGHEDHARTVLMTLGYYYYELTRTRNESYKHSSASWTGYDSVTKRKGIHQILKFLESGKPLAEFENYLNSDRFGEVVTSSMLKEYTLKDAVLQGELGELCKMIVFASKPENREHVQPTSWLSWR